MAQDTTANKPADEPAAQKDAPKPPSAEATDEQAAPQHKYYEVLTDTWGTDTADRVAPVKGDILTADEVGPHLKWAVANYVIAPISAKDSAERRKAYPRAGDKNALDPEDDAGDVERKTYATIMANKADPDDDLDTAARKAEARTRADVQRTRAAEDRQNRVNLQRQV